MRISTPLLIVSLLFPATAFAQKAPPPPGTKVVFSACPIRADIGVGCWLAINKGVTYNIGHANPPPQPNLVVLVSGTVSSNLSLCPVTLLDPIKVTITRQKCTPPKWPPVQKN